MIRVKCGGCGIKYTDANGSERHALKTPESGPFECDDAQAERLVGLGVAEYVGLQWRQVVDPAPRACEAQKDAARLDAAQLETMTNEQLKALAADMGVVVSGCKKKADYIAAIVADEAEPDDELPDLSAADPE